MGALLLIAAEAREFAGFVRRCRRSARLNWPVAFARMAELDGRSFLMVANGAGPVLAGQASDVAGMRERVEAVISTGFCGALDPALEAGDVFVASRIDALEQDESFDAGVPSCAVPHATGRLISTDRVVRTVEEKKRLRQLGAAAVEMEASAVAARAGRWGLPFFCVRGVVDRADEDLLLDFNAARDGAGRLRTARILKAAARRPSVLVPELYKMYRRSRMASDAVGEFLASCRF